MDKPPLESTTKENSFQFSEPYTNRRTCGDSLGREHKTIKLLKGVEAVATKLQSPNREAWESPSVYGGEDVQVGSKLNT